MYRTVECNYRANQAKPKRSLRASLHGMLSMAGEVAGESLALASLAIGLVTGFVLLADLIG